MFSAALTEGTLAGPVIAIVEVMVGMPARAAFVVLPLTQLRPFVSFGWPRLLTICLHACMVESSFLGALGLLGLPGCIVSQLSTEGRTLFWRSASTRRRVSVFLILSFIATTGATTEGSFALVEKLLNASSFTKLPEQALVSFGHPAPFHFLHPMLEDCLGAYSIIESILDDIPFDFLASILGFRAFVQKPFCKRFVPSQQGLIGVSHETQLAELDSKIR
jgi:hypothetical protein